MQQKNSPGYLFANDCRHKKPYGPSPNVHSFTSPTILAFQMTYCLPSVQGTQCTDCVPWWLSRPSWHSPRIADSCGEKLYGQVKVIAVPCLAPASFLLLSGFDRKEAGSSSPVSSWANKVQQFVLATGQVTLDVGYQLQAHLLGIRFLHIRIVTTFWVLLRFRQRRFSNLRDFDYSSVASLICRRTGRTRNLARNKYRWRNDRARFIRLAQADVFFCLHIH